MKNKNRLNIFASLVAAMFILSMFSGIAAAQTPAEQYEKKYRVQKEIYENTGKKFEDAKQLFEKANRGLKNSKDPKSQDELKLRARVYIESAIDRIIAHLEVLKYRAELPENKGVLPFDASKNIDAHIAQLEQLKTKVQQAATMQELKDAHMELKDIWTKISLETRYYIEIMLNHRIDNFITKADNVTARLDKAIENRKVQNKDVTELQKDAARYKDLVAEAKAIQQQTIGLFAAHSGFASDGTVTDNKAASEFVRQADKLQRDTIQKLKVASKQLLDFVRDFRKISGGKAGVSGSGELESNNGSNIEVTGTPTVTGTVAVNSTITPTVNATATQTATPTITATTTPAANATATPTETPTATSGGNTSTNSS